MRRWFFLGLGLIAALGLSSVQAKEAPSGKELVKRLNCMGCHSLAGKGGDGVVDQAHRFGAPHRKRHRDVGEDDGVFQRQNRQ